MLPTRLPHRRSVATTRTWSSWNMLKTLSGLPDRPPFELSAMTRQGIRPLASLRALIQELEAVIKAAESPTCG